jgi:predicted nucleic acid-binding protein
MTKYLLDTNIPVYLEDPDSPFHHPVKERCQQLQDEDQVYVSVLSLYELYYEAIKCRITEQKKLGGSSRS